MTTDPANTLTVARQAFAYFEQGLATGDWQAFFDMLTNDFSFWFPLGQFKGLNVGKERAIAFFNYVSEVYSEGLTLTLDRVIPILFEATQNKGGQGGVAPLWGPRPHTPQYIQLHIKLV